MEKTKIMNNEIFAREQFKDNKWLKQFGLMFFFAGLTFCFLVISPLHIWKNGDVGPDSSVFMTVAMMMDKGYMPYRDSFDHKGPLLYLIDYAGRQIALYRGVWLFEFLFLFITICYLYKTARILCGRKIACLIVIIQLALLRGYFEGGNLVEEYALPFICVALFIFMDYFFNQKISRFRLFMCGMCFGCVCLLRVNMIAVWVVCCIVVLAQCIREKKWKELGEYLLFFSLGIVTVGLPIVIWLGVNQSLLPFWEQYIEFNMVYSSIKPKNRWVALMQFVNQPVIILSLMIEIYLFKTKEKAINGICLAFIAVTLLFISVSGSRFGHYCMILVPTVTLPMADLFNVCLETFPEWQGRLVRFLLITYLTAEIAVPVWAPLISDLAQAFYERNDSERSYDVQNLCQIIDENTSGDVPISVYGSYDIVYVLCGKPHATQYSYQYPIGDIMPEIKDNYFKQLGEQLPEVIAIQPTHYDARMEQFLYDNNYTLAWAEVEGKPDGWQVYKHGNQKGEIIKCFAN